MAAVGIIVALIEIAWAVIVILVILRVLTALGRVEMEAVKQTAYLESIAEAIEERSANAA